MRRLGNALEEIEPERHPITEQIRLHERELVSARVLAVLHGSLGIEAAAEEIALADGDLPKEAVRGRITAGDRELAGGLLLDVDIDDDAIGRRARLGGDLDVFEEGQVLQAPFGAADQSPIVRIAFREVELAPDHVVARAGVAADVDLLDVDARPVVDREDEIDSPGLVVAVGARAHRRQTRIPGARPRSSCPRRSFRPPRHCRLHRGRAAPAIAPAPGSSARTFDTHIHGSDAILLALLDREADDEPGPRRDRIRPPPTRSARRCNRA